jgi:hypothetical protein
MSEWIPCGDAFLPADVVRWREGVWERPNRGKAKPRMTGERQVTAELLADEGDGWVRLLVRACVVIEDKSDGRRALLLKPGEEIKRKRSTLEKGTPERLRWSDESARVELLAQRPEPVPAKPRKPRGRKPPARKAQRPRKRP